MTRFVEHARKSGLLNSANKGRARQGLGNARPRGRTAKRGSLGERPRKVGILLSAPPASPQFPKALSAAEEAINQGSQLYMYCIDAGVEGLGDPAFGRLRDRGAKLFACAYSLQQRGLKPAVDATPSGLTVLSDIMASTDKFQSFT